VDCVVVAVGVCFCIILFFCVRCDVLVGIWESCGQCVCVCMYICIMYMCTYVCVHVCVSLCVCVFVHGLEGVSVFVVF